MGLIKGIDNGHSGGFNKVPDIDFTMDFKVFLWLFMYLIHEE